MSKPDRFFHEIYIEMEVQHLFSLMPPCPIDVTKLPSECIKNILRLQSLLRGDDPGYIYDEEPVNQEPIAEPKIKYNNLGEDCDEIVIFDPATGHFEL